jgi:hypothetical protein
MHSKRCKKKYFEIKKNYIIKFGNIGDHFLDRTILNLRFCRNRQNDYNFQCVHLDLSTL